MTLPFVGVFGKMLACLRNGFEPFGNVKPVEFGFTHSILRMDYHSFGCDYKEMDR